MIKSVRRIAGDEKWIVLHQPKSGRENVAPPNYLTVWTWPFSSPIDRLTLRSSYTFSVTPCPNASRLCVVDFDFVSVLRLSDWKVLAVASHRFSGGHFATAWSPDGREVAITKARSFDFYDSNTLKRRRTIKAEYPSDVAYSPDGALLALGTWNMGVVMEATDRRKSLDDDGATKPARTRSGRGTARLGEDGEGARAKPRSRRARSTD